MIILITGGSGFVGRAIVARLKRAGFTLRLAQRQSPSEPDLQHVSIGDLSDPVDWKPALDGVSGIVHAAGLAHQPPGTSDSAMFRINAEATARLAEAAKAAGVSRFIQISSVRAMIGASSAQIVTEATEPHPVDAYGRSKLEGEQALLASGLGGAILRPVLVAGAGAGGNLALLRKLARMPLPLPLGGLSGRRSLVSDRSLAEAVHLSLTTDLPPMTDYLVSHGDSLTVGEIVAALRKASGGRPNLFSIPQRLLETAAGLVGRHDMLERVASDLIVRSDRLAALGWQPVETTEAALARLITG